MPGGRPSKLTPELVAALAVQLPRVSYLKLAAPLVGVGISTLRGWLARGRRYRRDGIPPDADDGQLCLDLVGVCERSLSESIATALDSVREAAAGGDWRAGQWFAAVRYPEGFSNHRQQIQELYQRLAELEKQAKGGQP